MSDSNKIPNLGKLERELTQLKQELAEQGVKGEDEDVVVLNSRGVFETNFASKRVQLKFLNALQRAADLHSGKKEITP